MGSFRNTIEDPFDIDDFELSEDSDRTLSNISLMKQAIESNFPPRSNDFRGKMGTKNSGGIPIFMRLAKESAMGSFRNTIEDPFDIDDFELSEDSDRTLSNISLMKQTGDLQKNQPWEALETPLKTHLTLMILSSVKTVIEPYQTSH
ncbi:hypothetical protein L6452_32850 [Arctium lappa]|uniref:Uncharacterized protein n=1 Tax=Arctium lappa TaxID=4217 RepID=A0ACB8Z653_ARCLA|nr:hypothetical protein L6452_32850 [Arctium lappa]